jgi:hypothetical protein
MHPKENYDIYLQIREIFGDYHLAPFDAAHSPRLIIIADKVK